MNSVAAKRILEAALLCSTQPVSVRDMRAMLGEAVAVDTIRRLLLELQQEWQNRGLMLVQVATGWRFQSRPYMREYLERLNPEKPPKYSRAVMETLAIIAYRQPVTRGDMEDIRGVTINSTILKQLEDRGWIEVIGHREGPGRPALYATTRAFLDDLGLASLQDLPTLEAQELTQVLARLDQNSPQDAQADAAALPDEAAVAASGEQAQLAPIEPQLADDEAASAAAADTETILFPQAADGADPAAEAPANPMGSATDSLAPQNLTADPEGQTESQP